jgi:hypothetical protein
MAKSSLISPTPHSAVDNWYVVEVPGRGTLIRYLSSKFNLISTWFMLTENQTHIASIIQKVAIL